MKIMNIFDKIFNDIFKNINRFPWDSFEKFFQSNTREWWYGIRVDLGFSTFIRSLVRSFEEGLFVDDSPETFYR